MSFLKHAAEKSCLKSSMQQSHGMSLLTQFYSCCADGMGVVFLCVGYFFSHAAFLSSSLHLHPLPARLSVLLCFYLLASVRSLLATLTPLLP